MEEEKDGEGDNIAAISREVISLPYSHGLSLRGDLTYRRKVPEPERYV